MSETPLHDLADAIEQLVVTAYPGLEVQEVCAALEMVRIRLLVGVMEDKTDA